MKLIVAALLFTCGLSAQFFPFPGPGRIAAGGGGGGGGSIIFGSAVTNSDAANLSTISTTSTLNIASGDLVVVVAGFGVGGTPTATAACGGQSMTLVAYNRSATDSYHTATFYLQNAAANAAATCTVTISTLSTFRAILAANWSGVATTGALDQFSCNSASCDTLATTSTSRTAQNVTTTTANQVLVAIGMDWDGTTHTAANGFTLRADGDTPYLLDKLVSATGTYPSGNFSTVSPTDRYFSVFMTFKGL